jgi:uncharacterized protein YfeS
MEYYDDDWELSPANAHPIARKRLIQPFLWHMADDASPLGNDTGADTLAYFRSWRAGNRFLSPNRFISRLLSDWQIDDADWEMLDSQKLKRRLKKKWTHIIIRDEVALAVAFAQIVLEGKLDAEVKKKALFAIKRQLLDTMMDFRNWSDRNEIIERFTTMQDILSQDWS